MIVRYAVETVDNYDMEPRADGAWVFYDDIAPLLRDAERYRWIRSAGAWQSEEMPDSFDAAVDAEIAAEISAK